MAQADVVANSASNLYGEGVTQAEVEAYYASLKDPNDPSQSLTASMHA